MLKESPVGAVRLLFAHDEDGRVIGGASAIMTADSQHDSSVSPICWQPLLIAASISGPEHITIASGSSSVVAQDTSQSVDAELSMEDLVSIPRREGGDLELTFCIQGEVSGTIARVSYIKKTDAGFLLLSFVPLFSLIN
jgi:hypothetical protein